MLKDDVIYIRDLHTSRGATIMVIMDNMQIYNNKNDYIIWDDANERLYIFNATVDKYYQDEAPMELIMSTYENIQFIHGYYGSKTMKKVIQDEFVDKGLMSTAQQKIINKFIDTLNNEFVDDSNQGRSIDNVPKDLAKVVSAAINGKNLVITYDQELTNTEVDTTAFTVTGIAAGNTIASGSVDGPNKTITFTMTNAAVSTDTNIKISYTAAGTNNITCKDGEVENFTDLTVTNNTPAPLVPPVLASGTINKNTIVLTFDKVLKNTSADINAFTVAGITGGNTISSVNVNGSNKTITLTMAKTALSTDIVAVSYIATGTNDLAGTDNALVVNIVKYSVTNTTPVSPVVTNATINGTNLVLTFDKALSNTIADINAFAVSGIGAGNTISSVNVNGVNKTITLTMAKMAVSTDIVTISYTATDTNNLTGADGTLVVNFANRAVTNTTPVSPVVTNATINGPSLVLTFDKALSNTSVDKNRFTVSGITAGNTIASGSVNGTNKTITFTMTNAAVSTDTNIKISYTANGTNDLASIDGALVVNFASRAVTNNTPVPETAPVITDKSISGKNLIIKFNKPLNNTEVDISAFTVTGITAGNDIELAEVLSEDSSIQLTMVNAAVPEDTNIKLTYTATGTNDITGQNGIAVPNFTDIAISNLTPSV